MSEAILGIIVLVLIGYLYLAEKHYKEERQKLLDRIMAKSFTEYKDYEPTPQDSPPSVPPDLIPISEASDQQFNQAIDKELGQKSIIQQAKEALTRKVKV